MKRLLATAVVLCAASTAPGWPIAPGVESPQRAHPAVCRVVVPNRDGASFGSGTLVAADDTHGLVVTNWHVVRDAAGPITVVFPDGFRSGATVLRTDRDWDLAALAVRRPGVRPVAVAAAAPRPGETLTIAGYGKGSFRAASGQCTQYVSPGGNFPFEMVELAAPAREGDSGGPILNERGELAGVLFGAAFGRTTGSYCGRVRWFLAGVIDDFHRLPGEPTMIAQKQQADPVPVAAIPAYASPAIGKPATVAAVPSPPVAAAVEGPGRAEQFKTVLAAIGAILILLHAMRLLGRAVG